LNKFSIAEIKFILESVKQKSWRQGLNATMGIGRSIGRFPPATGGAELLAC
jgi:hypothetical protein